VTNHDAHPCQPADRRCCAVCSSSSSKTSRCIVASSSPSPAAYAALIPQASSCPAFFMPSVPPPQAQGRLRPSSTASALPAPMAPNRDSPNERRIVVGERLATFLLTVSSSRPAHENAPRSRSGCDRKDSSHGYSEQGPRQATKTSPGSPGRAATSHRTVRRCADHRKTNRATLPRRRHRLEPVPGAGTVSGKQTVSGCGLLAAMLGAALAISIMLAPSAAARGAEGEQVCTGPQDPTNSCHPHALQQVPLGDQMPEGCKPSGPGTKACGELTHHLLEASATGDPQSNAASGQPGIEPHSSVSIQAGAQVRGTPPAPHLASTPPSNGNRRSHH
jgi:hypothetical protein